MAKPIIGITMGDPSGIGPEIIVKSLIKNNSYMNCSFLVIGNASHLKNTARQYNLNININVQ